MMVQSALSRNPAAATRPGPCLTAGELRWFVAAVPWVGDIGAEDVRGAYQMRGVVFTSPVQPVQVTDVDLAPPGPGEVRVKIAAAGVCHSDLHVRRGEWTVPVPLVMGHEGSGVVTETGPGVTNLAEGDHVVLSWVAPCGRCRYCLAGREARCQLAATVVAPRGVLHDGTSRLSLGGRELHHYLGVSSFADEAVVPASGAIKIREDAPLDTAALVGCAVATGVGAVTNTAGVEPGSVVAVIGCGGVGLSVVQGARLAQAGRIIALDIRPEKATLAGKLGATDKLDVSRVDAVEAVRELAPDGVDYVFDAIGLTETTEQAIRMLGLGGAAVVVGLPPAGATARFEPLALAEADQRILGSNYGSVRPAIDIPRLVDLFMDGELRLEELVSGRRPLDGAAAALDELDAGVALRTLLIPGTGAGGVAAPGQA
jgi:S-(hydroxymethyl)glutathione dehydrogenase/alcohol dehydrogenase